MICRNEKSVILWKWSAYMICGSKPALYWGNEVPQGYEETKQALSWATEVLKWYAEMKQLLCWRDKVPKWYAEMKQLFCWGDEVPKWYEETKPALYWGNKVSKRYTETKQALYWGNEVSQVYAEKKQSLQLRSLLQDSINQYGLRVPATKNFLITLSLIFSVAPTLHLTSLLLILFYAHTILEHFFP